MTPVKPSEMLAVVKETRISRIPDFVIKAVNGCVVEAYSKLPVSYDDHKLLNTPVQISQERIMEAVMAAAPEGTKRHEIFNNKWLDFEPIFKEYGWDVTYYKAHYSESGDSHFTFKPGMVQYTSAVIPKQPMVRP